MNKDLLEKLLNNKDESVRQLAKEYVEITTHSYYKSVVTMQGQLDDWNQQLKIETDSQGGIKNRIDLFADKEAKEFDRALKIFDLLLEFNEKIEKMKLKFTPEEAKDLQKEIADTTYEKALEEVKIKK